MSQKEEEHQSKSIKSFAVIVLVAEVIIAVLYCLFVRIDPTIRTATDTETNLARYPAYQDVNVMMLIGFGFLMTFIKSHAWSALSFTFFINAIIVQLYILLSAFWERVIVHGFHEYYISIKEVSFTAASYAVASILIAFGGVLGRVGPKEFLVMSLVQIVGYSLNEQIVYNRIGALDVGGSMAIHTFGAYFGLTVSRFLSSIAKPATRAQTSYNSNIFAMIGTIFLWMYWPSFNFGVFAKTDFAKAQIVTNTILSLTGSCLTTFMTSAFLKKKFNMEHILNATLAGGVVIGAPAGLIYNPGSALIIGAFIGIISTLCFQFLTPKLEEKLGLYDTCGIHNLHGLPGLIGGILSAVVVATYKYTDNWNPTTITSGNFPEISIITADPYKQGALQIAGTFVSMGLGITFGIIAGFFMKCIYSVKASEFYQDEPYFEDVELEELPSPNHHGIKHAEVVLNTTDSHL